MFKSNWKNQVKIWPSWSAHTFKTRPCKPSGPGDLFGLMREKHLTTFFFWSKTSYMLFRNRPPDVDFNVFIEHERINRVHVTKFLGIYIDDKLNWKYHINTVRSKLSKVAAIIYRASCLINQDGIYMLYCSLFLPYINYCSEIWGNTYCTNVECITVLQKRVVRLVCGARRLDHTNPLFKQLGILKFVDLVKFKTSIIMFKAYHNVLPDSLQKMFTLRVQIYDTRQKCTFTVHRAHTNVKSMCISIYGVKLWNSLHTDLTNSRSLQVIEVFKRCTSCI